MKTTKKLLSALLLGLIMVTTFSACSKDDDPANDDLFVGTYNGTISYKNGETTIQDEDGKVTVQKIDDTYKFYFGSNIPDISGVKFEKSGDNSYVSIGSGFTGITIDQNTLKILVSKDGETWTANCTR